MSNNLGKIERNAYVSYHQDGLIDIAIGVYVLSFGLMMLTDMPWLAGALVLVLMAPWMWAKRKITYPRIGYVTFPTGLKAKTGRMLTALVAVGAVFFLMGVLIFGAVESGTRPSWLTIMLESGLILVGLMGAALASAVALFLGIKRFYVYAVVILALFGFGHLSQIFLPHLVIVFGGTVICAGLVVLRRFLRKHPLPGASSIEAE